MNLSSCLLVCAVSASLSLPGMCSDNMRADEGYESVLLHTANSEIVPKESSKIKGTSDQEVLPFIPANEKRQITVFLKTWLDEVMFVYADVASRGPVF